LPARYRRFRPPLDARPSVPSAGVASVMAAVLASFLLPGCASPPLLVHVAPPAVRGEVRPPRPGPGYLWEPGRWEWREGRHVWAAGHWIQGKPGRMWVPGHWRRLGDAWTWEPGRWEPA